MRTPGLVTTALGSLFRPRHWPLRFRFGVYAGALTAVTSMLGILAVRPMIYRHQLADLDAQLRADAAEVVADFTKYGGAQVNFRKPISARFIPASLGTRFLQLNGPEGQLLYRSTNLRGLDISHLTGTQTVRIDAQEARFSGYIHGYVSIHVGANLTRLAAIQQDLGKVLLWVVPSAGLAAFGVGWLLGGRALRPVIQLTEAAEKIKATEPGQRLPVPVVEDEIFRLSQVLNHSFDRMQKSYSAAERFSADASHQMKTPLSILRLGLESLRKLPETNPAQLSEIVSLEWQTRRLTTLVDDLLLLAQADAGQLSLQTQRVDLQLSVAEMADDLGIYCQEAGIELEVLPGPPLWGLGDSRRIAVILQNLGENAAKYTPGGGKVSLRTTQQNGQVAVRVANTAPAIPGSAREGIFQRFHRGVGAQSRTGHGLGLNIARSLARAQGGDVVLLGEGATGQSDWVCFEFWLQECPDNFSPEGK